MGLIFLTLYQSFLDAVRNLHPVDGYEFVRNAALRLRDSGLSAFAGEAPIRPGPRLPALVASLNQGVRQFQAGDLQAARDTLWLVVADATRDGDLFTRIDALYHLGRVNHEDGVYRLADEFYDQAQSLAERCDYVDVFMRTVHEKARLGIKDYKLLESELGFRLACDYYCVVILSGQFPAAESRNSTNMAAAIMGLRSLAERWVQFSQGPVEAAAFLDGLGSPAFTSADNAGYDFLEVRALALYGISYIPQHQGYVANLIQKAIKLHSATPPISALALDEAEYIATFTNDGHVSVVKQLIRNPVRVALRTQPFVTVRAVEPPSQPKPYGSADRPAQSIGVLLDFLASSDQRGTYVYRGQTKDYHPLPLLPSAFRGILTAEFGSAPRSYTPDEYQRLSLRKSGKSFHGEYNRCFSAYSNPVKHLQAGVVPEADRRRACDVYRKILQNTSVSVKQRHSERFLPWKDAIRSELVPAEVELFDANEPNWMPLINHYHRYQYRMGPFVHLFGYALGTVMAQQYGLSSEGLDATTSLDVAAFFATHDSRDFRSIPAQGVGIIYRFPYTPSDIATSPLSKYDFYSLPSIVDVRDIMYRFEKPHLRRDDCLKCFEYYFGSVYIEGVRDTDFVFVPEGFAATSRVYRQHAAIIFPDELRKDREDRGSDVDGIRDPEFRYIEDLAERDGVEKFYFRHDGVVPEGIHKLSREHLWPRGDDVLKVIVKTIAAEYPLRFEMPKRLDLIDGGYEQEEFVAACANMAAQDRIRLFNVSSKLARSSFGTVIL